MQLRAYAPRALEENADYTASYSTSQESGKLYVATALVNDWYTDYTAAQKKVGFASLDCDFAEPLVITVTPASPRQSVVIRPKALKIPYEFDGKELKITLTSPARLSIEFDGDMYHNLFLFANAPVEIPTGEKVKRFDKGVYELDKLSLSDGDTVYIDGDTVLYGVLEAKGKNIRLCGRGILSGEKHPHDPEGPRSQLARFVDCEDLEAEGIILLDSPAWTFVTVGGRNIHVDNIKQVCWNANSDGFDICGSENVLIENCFLRNWDDSISLKSFGSDNRNITMRRCVLWADRAHNMLIGPEAKTNAPNTFSNILFEDIDVLEHREFSTNFMGVMAIFCADRAIFENITWRNIRIERLTYGRIFDFRYVTLFADSVGTSCRNVLMENISCEASVPFRSRILGLDEDHIFEGVTLRNVTYQTHPVDLNDPMVEVNEFTSALLAE